MLAWELRCYIMDAYHITKEPKMFNLILMPAYGKTYANKSEALADWTKGEDFRVVGTSSYCSIRDTKALAQRHNNLLLSAKDGGCRIEISPCKRNPLDSLL